MAAQDKSLKQTDPGMARDWREMRDAVTEVTNFDLQPGRSRAGPGGTTTTHSWVMYFLVYNYTGL